MIETDEAAILPRDVAVRLAHATVQAIADTYGLSVLHIKGPIVDATLRADALDARGAGGIGRHPRRNSVDADVLVQPQQADELVRAMERHGWTLAWDFDEGSLFAHAATLTHPHLAHVDIHRIFPGIECEPAAAFRILEADARRVPIAELPCTVPSDDAHRLVLLLHAARSPGHPDVGQMWTAATPDERAAVRHLAERLNAVVALAAATGELESVRQHRSYRLWRALQRPRNHREALVGHVIAAGPRRAVPLLWRFLMLNKRRMDRERGAAVGVSESLAAYRGWVVQRMRRRR